jgi:hypothetical protein
MRNSVAMSRKKRFVAGAAAAVAAAVISVLGVAMPASASETDTTTADESAACLQAAQDLESSGQSGDYACLVTTPTAETEKAASTSRIAGDVVGCYDTTPTRTIYGEYSSEVVFSIIYGQVDDPVNGSWSNCIDGTFTIGLQDISHLATLTAYSVMHNGAVDLSGNITMEHMNGILPSATVDSLGYTKLSGNGFSYSGYLGGTGNGVYSAKMGNMTIMDYDKAHEFSLDVDLSTYRFLCNIGEQCRYPDGAEAPVFG